MFVVTRQSNYYDEGAFSVEIARNLDCSGPGALAQKFGEDFFESEDPREIAEAAIRLRKQWYLSQPEGYTVLRDFEMGYIPFTIAMNHLVYATVNDGLTAAGLRRWAKQMYEKLPKCEWCGEVVNKEGNYYVDGGEIVTACSDLHAEMLSEPFLEDEEENEDMDRSANFGDWITREYE